LLFALVGYARKGSAYVVQRIKMPSELGERSIIFFAYAGYFNDRYPESQLVSSGRLAHRPRDARVYVIDKKASGPKID